MSSIASLFLVAVLAAPAPGAALAHEGYTTDPVIVKAAGREPVLQKAEPGYKHRSDESVPDNRPRKGFHGAIVRLGIIGTFGDAGGGIFSKERRVLRAYETDLAAAYVIPHRYRLQQSVMSCGATIDLMAPALRLREERVFDLSGIKFGFRARYSFVSIDSSIMQRPGHTIDIYNQKFEANLLSYHCVTGGPVMNLIFGRPRSFIILLITGYGTVGPVAGGELAPIPALRAARLLAMRMMNAGGLGPGFLFGGDRTQALLHSRRFNITRIGGYTARLGLGPEVVMNGFVPVSLGLHATYAYTALTLERPPIVYYDGNRRAAHHEWGGEASLAFHW